MAEVKDVGAELPDSQAGAAPEAQKNSSSRPSSAKPGANKESEASRRDREERLRQLKERQNEERQKKLEELKQQALAAQKFREQKEEERRRRMEELRLRDTDRRHQVEERKRQIWEAERDRREAILRKNQEREARIETKRKNERSQIVFAFGSSTPRMLEPSDTAGSYWATRRATSTSNVMMMSMSAAPVPGPLTRRSSERELDGGKKRERATSAGGINRSKQPGDEGDGEESGSVTPVPAAGTLSARAARRKTDLMPTLPSPRDLTPRPARSPGLHSGEVTPSRPTSSLSQHSMSAMSSSVHAAFKPRATPRRPRPASIAVTGVSTDVTTPTRHSLSSEHRSSKSPATPAAAAAPDKDKPPLPKVPSIKKSTTPKPDTPKKPTDKIKSTKSSASATPKETPLQSPGVESAASVPEEVAPFTTTTITTVVSSEQDQSEGSLSTTTTTTVTTVTTDTTEALVDISEPVVTEKKAPEVVPSPAPATLQEEPLLQQEVAPLVPDTVPVPTKDTTSTSQEHIPSDLAECDMTASMLAKTRITTEEEAKAALAERRRLVREQAEREAELERQRVEAERLAEEQRLREEEEEQRRLEEEQLRLLEEARQAEQERLRQAIEEAQKREEEEKLQRIEEAKQRQEKEEADRKAKEEAERQRQEMELRLKKEEEERIERRKRVEAIMSRTRGKGSTPSNTPTKEDADDSPVEESRRLSDQEHQEQFLHSERNHSAANTRSSVVRQNGHQNGVDNVVEQNNVTNNLLDLSLESVGGSSPLPLPIPIPILPPSTETNGKLANEDSVNFNTAPSNNPFIAFQENKKQDTVNDLLS